MSAIPFDTHAYIKDEVATKRDLKEIEFKIELVRAELKKDLKDIEVKIFETKAELIRWVVAAGFLQSALIIGVVLKVAKLV